MKAPRWPKEYNQLIPQGTTLVLEMREKGYQSLLRGEQYFYLGQTPEHGIAIWLDLMYDPIKPKCFSLLIPLSEIYEIQDRLLLVPIGTGPGTAAVDGSRGIVRVSTCYNHEISMEWRNTPAGSWRGIFSIINEIRDNILQSPDRVAIPPRKWIHEVESQTLQDEE